MHPVLALLVLGTSCAACSSGAVPASVSASDSGSEALPFPDEPYAVTSSEDGSLQLEVRTSPQPPPRGTCTLELRVKDAHGTPQDGLELTVVPWMPAMGHGASVKPTVVAQGSGRYLVTNVSLFMPGRWELRTTLTGPTTSHASPVLTVP
jgi:hypothetical protein